MAIPSFQIAKYRQKILRYGAQLTLHIWNYHTCSLENLCTEEKTTLFPCENKSLMSHNAGRILRWLVCSTHFPYKELSNLCCGLSLQRGEDNTISLNMRTSINTGRIFKMWCAQLTLHIWYFQTRAPKCFR